MFYSYKVYSFEGAVYYYPDKESIFKMIDLFSGPSFLFKFCNEFEVGTGSIVHSEKRIVVDSIFDDEDNYKYYPYKIYVKTYRNGHYRIETFSGAVVDILELYESYKQSRKIKEFKPKRYIRNSWAKRKRRPHVVKYQSGIVQELSQNIFDTMEGYVKIRKERANAVKGDYFFESGRISGKPQSWKNNKKKKQWM